MMRLPFRLPDFTRFAWASDVARTVWAPRFSRVAVALRELEVLAVVAGLRRCALLIIEPEELAGWEARWADHGLHLLVLDRVGASAQPYSAESVPYASNARYLVRIVLGRTRDITALRDAWSANDHVQVGLLLGYPLCCARFFAETWVDAGWVDTTWPMAVGTQTSADTDRLVEVSGPPEANILWRWAGLRAVPHLPCGFACGATSRFGQSLWQLSDEFGVERAWLYQVLDWPVEWSCLHGIAVIRTPVLKIVARSDATGDLYTVRRKGGSYPAEGLPGIGFPYENTSTGRVAVP